jgi:hypothetical protein
MELEEFPAFVYTHKYATVMRVFRSSVDIFKEPNPTLWIELIQEFLFI